MNKVMIDNVRSPKNGYDFKEKSEYRLKVWSIFAEKIDTETAKVLFLPSKEGLEIPIALSCGFKEENLIAVDDCPAVIASSRWRKEYPKIKFYGNKLSRAAQRIRKDGIIIAAANLDLCGNISKPTINEIVDFISSGCLLGECVISLTMLCGREQTAVNTLAELFLEAKKETFSGFKYSKFSKRIQVICALIHNKQGFNLKYEYEGSYKSGTQKMSFGIFSMLHRLQAEYYIDKYAELLSKDIENYCKIRTEHRDFRFYWSIWPSRKKYLDTGKIVKISQKKITEAQLTNDIYRVWLDKERSRLECVIDSTILNKLKSFDSDGCFLFASRATSYTQRSKELWQIFCHNDFYSGCKGNQSQAYCEDRKKATKYLNEINWDIRR